MIYRSRWSGWARSIALVYERQHYICLFFPKRLSDGGCDIINQGNSTTLFTAAVSSLLPLTWTVGRNEEWNEICP